MDCSRKEMSDGDAGRRGTYTCVMCDAWCMNTNLVAGVKDDACVLGWEGEDKAWDQ